jgi:hypothetical protein
MADEIMKTVNDVVELAIMWLWNSGWGQWIPALIFILLLFWTQVLYRRLPWHNLDYSDFEQFLNGVGTHKNLVSRLRKARDSIECGGDGVVRSDGYGFWLRSMFYAQSQLNLFFGSQVWSFGAFKLLLLMAFAYPVILLFVVWWFTGVGQLGQVTVLPSLGDGIDAFLLRGLIVLLFFSPFFIARWVDLFFINGRRSRWGLDFLIVGKVFLIITAFVASKLIDSFPLLYFVVFSLILLYVRISDIEEVLGGVFAIMFVVVSSSFFSGWYAIGFAMLGALFSWLLLLSLKFFDGLMHAFFQVVIFFVFFLLFALCSSWYFPISFGQDDLASFLSISTFLFLLLWIPPINAIFDWISLGVTRQLIRKMTAGVGWMWAGFALDVMLGIVLTMALFFAILEVLNLLSWMGWPLDAQQIRLAFIRNPLDPQVSWIALLALTNIVPTLWYFSVSLLGFLDRQFMYSFQHFQSLRQLNEVIHDDGSIRVDAVIPCLGEKDKVVLFNSLFVHSWLYIGFVIALVFGLWGSYLDALRWLLALTI